jgi:hypothetical protein
MEILHESGDGKLLNAGMICFVDTSACSFLIVLDKMTILDHVVSLSGTGLSNANFIKLFRLMTSVEKSDRRAEYRDINIQEAIFALRRETSESASLSVSVFGSLVKAVAIVYSKQIGALELSTSSALSQFDRLHDPSAAIHRSVIASSTRKRRVVETPLAVVPEDALLLDGSSLDFELPQNLVPALAMSRTPLTGRRRLFSTPRSVSEDPVFESTPIVHTPDLESKRQKRMSSVSDVMDSLRADDGHRRLSGLLMTANNSMPPSPSALDDFDIGIDPPSPWDDQPTLALSPLGSPSEAQSGRRRQPKKKNMMDKRGRWGIEIDPSKVQGRREWYLEESEFYIEKLKVDKIRRFKLADVVSDRTGHFVWFTKPTARPVSVQNDGMFDDFPQFPEDSFEHEIDTPKPVAITIEERLAEGKTSLKELVELESKKPVRRTIARNFVDVLTCLSTGRAQIVSSCDLSFGLPTQTLVVAV